ncbi:hypothetical protein [Flavobacterium litorale]|uniref:Lipoprotein n=1 Tax=Flavobacterium litorale TaxID=2856519 RepID=A0ABX8VAE5_9FLAO|nr:hypothetical protein [Flavobacterium litorale]QYJ67616.1 hypothetical protein K1I41_08625 [Flavobacterium litorale]
MKKILKYATVMSFAVLALSCSNDDSITDSNANNADELVFKTKSTEPTISYTVRADLISMDNDCYVYRINHLFIDENGTTLAFSVIMHSGSGCDDEGVGDANKSIDGTGLYKGDIIEKDFLINGKTTVSLWESDPKAYLDYIIARDEMISNN